MTVKEGGIFGGDPVLPSPLHVLFVVLPWLCPVLVVLPLPMASWQAVAGTPLPTKQFAARQPASTALPGAP